MPKTNENNSNEKTIHKILHIVLDSMKIIYEICKVFKAIISLFF